MLFCMNGGFLLRSHKWLLNELFRVWKKKSVFSANFALCSSEEEEEVESHRLRSSCRCRRRRRVRRQSFRRLEVPGDGCVPESGGEERRLEGEPCHTLPAHSSTTCVSKYSHTMYGDCLVQSTDQHHTQEVLQFDLIGEFLWLIGFLHPDPDLEEVISLYPAPFTVKTTIQETGSVTWGGEERESETAEREGLEERKRKLAAIGSLRVRLTIDFWLQHVGLFRDTAAVKALRWAVALQDVFDMWNVRCWLKTASCDTAWDVHAVLFKRLSGSCSCHPTS